MEVEPNVQEFDLKAIIGQGCGECGVVSLAWHKHSRQHVAIKRINLEKCEMDFSTIQHEVFQHRLLCHPNVQPCLCSFVSNNEVWIVTPLMEFGSCRDLLQAHFTDGLPEMAIAYILKDVLSALQYIHNRGVIHRSVKASHILISGSGLVTISGLRYSYSMMKTGRRSRAVHNFPDHYVDSLLWASPELLEQNLGGYDTKSDIYSIGITSCELANGIVPFCDMQPTQMLLQKIQGVQPKLLDSSVCRTLGGSDEAVQPLTFNRSFSSHFHEFVKLCLQTDSAVRPSATALLQHAFFKQIRRRSGGSSLPELLHPVQPLSQPQVPKDDSLIQDITQALTDTTLDDLTWDF